MTTVAQIVGLLSGAWLIGLGVWMAAVPRRALAVLAAMGSTANIHFGEMIIRVLIGAALVGAGPASRCPLVMTVAGGFLIISALALMALPRRWHAAYSIWWAARIPPIAVRFVAPFSILGGGALIWCLGWPF
jgi:hypothetical protein